MPLTVQASLIFACGWLAPHLSAFRADHPDIHLNIATGNHAGDFRGTDCDWQILFGGPWDMPVHAEPLMGERLHPVAGHEIVHAISRADDILDRPLIEVSTHRTGRLQVLSGRIARPFSDATILFADNSVLAMGLAAGGCGIALSRAPACDGLVAAHGLAVLPEGLLPPVASGQGYFLVPAGPNTGRPAAQSFRTWLLDATEPARRLTSLPPQLQSG